MRPLSFILLDDEEMLWVYEALDLVKNGEKMDANWMNWVVTPNLLGAGVLAVPWQWGSTQQNNQTGVEEI